MTQEERELLKDLSARYSYGMIVSVTDGTIKYDAYIESVSHKNIQVSPVSDSNFTPYTFYKISEIKPYLRPLSSMTEEEKSQYNFYLTRIECAYDASLIIDWLNAHFLDYRGFISKGLALEAPKDMYSF